MSQDTHLKLEGKGNLRVHGFSLASAWAEVRKASRLVLMCPLSLAISNFLCQMIPFVGPPKTYGT